MCKSHTQITKSVAALFFIFISSPSFSQIKTINELRDSIEKIMTNEHMPGLSVALIQRDSVIWRGGIGIVDRTTNKPVTETDLFRIGSITKTFVSLAIQKLITAGKFSLNSKLRDIAPEVPFENDWEAQEPVRVIHLLEHTAGFDDMHLNAFINFTGKKIPALNEVLIFKKSLHSRWKPGTRHSYSNPGYAILGYLIEKYSGMSYEDYIFQQIILPLKMDHTNFDYTLDPPYSKGYSYDGEYHESKPVMINGRAAGAVSSCSKDMARFVRMFLNDGQLDGVQIISAASLNGMEIQHSTLRASNGLPYGYGSAISHKLSGSDKNKKHFLGNDGGMVGFASDFYYSRELGVGFFLSNNGETSNYKIIDLISEFLVSYVPVILPTPQKLNVEKIKPWLGYYMQNNSRNEIFKFMDDLLSPTTLFVENDTLFTSAFLQNKNALIPVDGFQFRRYNQPIPTSILAKDASKPVLFIDENYYEKISPVTYYVHRSVILSALFFGAISIIMSIVWTILFFMKRMTFRELMGRSISSFAILQLSIMFMIFIRNVNLKNIPNLASMNGWTLTIFICSILFPLLSFWGLYRSLRIWKFTKNKVLKSFMVITSICLSYLAIYLAVYGWFAIKIWNY
jgi:CubicO group peptidase (beta-lactamase class C family)